MLIHSYTGMYDPQLPQFRGMNPPGESYPLDWQQLMLPTTNSIHAAPLLHGKVLDWQQPGGLHAAPLLHWYV